MKWFGLIVRLLCSASKDKIIYQKLRNLLILILLLVVSITYYSYIQAKQKNNEPENYNAGQPKKTTIIETGIVNSGVMDNVNISGRDIKINSTKR